MNIRQATSRDELPIFFEAGDETLFGILTRPTSDDARVGVILVYGGAYNMTANVNQMWLRTARSLAARGFHVLRYDYRGIGDSTGKAGVFDHRSPYTEDLRGAIQVMHDVGLDRVYIVGDCLGARASLVCASDTDGIEALLMLVPMVRDATKGKDEEWAAEYSVTHYLRRAVQPSTWKGIANPTVRRNYVKVAKAKINQLRSRQATTVGNGASEGVREEAWVSDMFLELFEAALRRGVDMHILFGADDTERIEDFEAARRGRLGTMIEAAGDQVTIHTVTGSVAGITDLDAQQEVIDYAENWAVGTLSKGAEGPSAGRDRATHPPKPAIDQSPGIQSKTGPRWAG